jgi:predicted MFS family arabinose efflux permease
MLAPLLTPIIGRAFGWSAAIVVACAVCAVGGLLWLGITPDDPRRNGDEAARGEQAGG